jgi:glycerol uptake facilitator protein
MDDNRTWQRLAAEFLGTAFLVFVGVGSVPAFALVRGDAPFTPAELGFISLAWREVPGYLVAQVLGATVGAFAIVGVLGQQASELGLGVASYGDIPVWQAFTAEFIGTFLLVFTVFGVIHRKAAPGFAGIVIGLVVFAAIIPVAPATGASINPARTTGPMLVQQVLGGTVQWEQWPVYVIAEIVGGIAAGLLFVVISRTQADRTTLTEALEEEGARA